jgi:hypothetical protein
MSKRVYSADKIRKTLLVAILVITLFALNYELASAQVTIFNNSISLSTISLTFPQEFITRTFFVSVPNGTVTEARMRIQGFDMQGRKGLPRDVILVTDTSLSMAGSKITSAKAADKNFISNVDTNYVHVGLVHYSTTASKDSNLTNNNVVLNSTIDGYIANGYTNIGAALNLAIAELSSQRAQRTGTKKYILLMTDGWANVLQDGSYQDTAYYNNLSEAWVLSLAKIANQSNITIYAISFGTCGTTYSGGGGGGTAHCVFMENVSNQTKGGMHFHAPTGQDLIKIYENISEMIETNNLTTPTMNSISPSNIFAWSYPDLYNGNALWNLSNCGIASASCSNFRTLIQSNLNVCTSYPCNIRFSVYSTTVGMLNLSDLYIEINVPPVGNYPPIGNCLSVPMLCNQDVAYVGMDDASPSLVTDANDALNTLTWRYDSFRSIESAGGSHFSYNNNFNTVRQLAFLVDSSYLQNPFWKTFFFNISDPWGASTLSCINVSYAGCAITSACGNTFLEPGEQCEPNNNQKNSDCYQDNESCQGQRLSTRPDHLGYCSDICECYNDSWSAAICAADKCGASCSEDQYLNCTIIGGWPGIRTCNITTCQWNNCIPTGTCGDTKLNQESEQCEPTNSQNNQFCQQDNESCDGPKLSTRPDLRGNCDNNCQCYNDTWSTAVCVAEKCGAACSENQNRDCTTPGGYPGIETCNITTCQWNTCTPTGTCGDNVTNQESEQCEPINTDNNDHCSQENESCIGVQLRTRPDLLGNCNNECQCYNDTWSTTVCVAEKCGAACSDQQTRDCTIPGGWPGIETCNITTCQWNNCIPTGRCGDGAINQETEQCEMNNTLNNPYCEQVNESCIDAPKVRIRDSNGSCDAMCLCVEDPWSPSATCIANKCGAICTAGTSQACTTADGYPGNQDCNDTTCDWNTCTTTLSCGDNILTNPPETCEYPGTSNNTNCSQSTEQCVGPKIAIRDLFGDCNATCGCDYDIFGEALNCSVDKCGAACDATTPSEDCATGAGRAGTRSCNLATCTMGGCVRKQLQCKSSKPKYLLHTGQTIIISLSDIFDGDTGDLSSISHSDTSAITINNILSDSEISVSSDDATFETVNIQVTAEGVDSESCPVAFLNLDSRCDRPVCEAYANAGDFEGLNSSGCLDNEIWVTDPYAEVRISNYISQYLLPSFAFLHPTYNASFAAFDGFGVEPSTGTQETMFRLTNLTNISHGTEGSSVIKINFNDYENKEQDYVRICPRLKRYHYNIGELGYDPNSTLLITGSRAVSGYYEKDGFVFSKGPYIFIAKVWMREFMSEH